MTKFKVGDKVIADGDEAVITQIILPDDRNWDDPGMPVWYAVEWPTNEWGTFSEDELRRVGGGMNERIRLLAEQVDIHFSRAGILDGDRNGYARMVGYSKMEKFAELIVRECVGVVDDAVNYREPASTYVGKIREHFGVKE